MVSAEKKSQKVDGNNKNKSKKLFGQKTLGKKKQTNHGVITNIEKAKAKTETAAFSILIGPLLSRIKNSYDQI